MVVIIIEEARAVDQIDEILSVPGIDVVFIGPNDLSYSYGFRGKQDEPKVKEAIATIVAAAQRHKLPVGRTATAAQIPDLIKQGFTFFQAASDLSFMAQGARPILEAAGKTAAAPKALY